MITFSERFQGFSPAWTACQSTWNFWGSCSSLLIPATASRLLEMERQNGLGAVGELDRVAGADGDAARGRERGTELGAVGLHDHQRLALIERLDLERGARAADARRPAADGLVGVGHHHVVGDL